jgi:hypothetical protein
MEFWSLMLFPDCQLEDGRKVNQQWLSWVASENIDAAYLFEKVLFYFILFANDYIFFMIFQIVP